MCKNKVIETIDDCNRISYVDLANSNVKYYKISKSNSEIANMCCENFTKKYPDGQMVECQNGHGLSFVPENSVICCIPYGDQLTEFAFEHSNLEIMKECKYYYTGNALLEFTGNKLFVKTNKSLANPKTLCEIISMCSPNFFLRAVNAADILDIGLHLKKLGFLQTKSFWDYAIKDIKGTANIENYMNVINSIETIYKSWINLT